MWCWCEPSRDVCENLVVLNGNNGAQPPTSKLAARNSAVLLWAAGVGVEHVGPGHGKLGAGGCVPHASGAAQALERGRRCALAFHGRDDLYILQTRSPRRREARTGGDLGLTAMGWQGQGSHGYVLQDVSHTGEWAVQTVVAMNVSDP